MLVNVINMTSVIVGVSSGIVVVGCGVAVSCSDAIVELAYNSGGRVGVIVGLIEGASVEGLGVLN